VYSWGVVSDGLHVCRDSTDFDDEEYRAASRAVGEHTYAIIKVREV
jgi:hypothetical protein